MKTVLIVDDQRHMVRLIEFTLRPLGCQIVTAASGEEALQTAAVIRIHLLVIDLVLPGIDGFETVREFQGRPEYTELPIVMLTGRGQEKTRHAAAASQIALFLTKPFSPIELRGNVARLLG